jgi:hypothetical protein
MTSEPSRLLIVGCSQRKRPDPGLLPAIERYNGPQFQVLRKFLREFPDKVDTLNVYILSAKFGLISGNKLIPNYDYKMTQKRAGELHYQVLGSLKQYLEESHHDECFVSLGKTYLPAIGGYEQVIPSELKIFVSQGSLGRRQTELRDWLYSKLPDRPLPQTPKSPLGTARIRGVEVVLTPKQILDEARKFLANDQCNLASYHTWYVQVDDQRVAPKWLVSQLTGLPVGSFHSGEARRVLQQLGVEVKNV